VGAAVPRPYAMAMTTPMASRLNHDRAPGRNALCMSGPPSLFLSG
jgi:hypothetical protein